MRETYSHFRCKMYKPVSNIMSGPSSYVVLKFHLGEVHKHLLSKFHNTSLISFLSFKKSQHSRRTNILSEPLQCSGNIWKEKGDKISETRKNTAEKGKHAKLFNWFEAEVNQYNKHTEFELHCHSLLVPIALPVGRDPSEKRMMTKILWMLLSSFSANCTKYHIVQSKAKRQPGYHSCLHHCGWSPVESKVQCIWSG